METKTGLNEIGVTMRGTGVAGLADVMTVQGTMTGIQDIEVTGGMATEVDIEGTSDRDRGPPEGGRGPGRRTTADADVLKTG